MTHHNDGRRKSMYHSNQIRVNDNQSKLNVSMKKKDIFTPSDTDKKQNVINNDACCLCALVSLSQRLCRYLRYQFIGLGCKNHDESLICGSRKSNVLMQNNANPIDIHTEKSKLSQSKPKLVNPKSSPAKIERKISAFSEAKVKDDSHVLPDSEVSIFHHLVEHPLDYSCWFQLLFDQNGNVVVRDKVIQNITTLSSLLESIRNNVALDFIDGIMHLLIDDYENEDDNVRFKMAIKSLKDFLPSERQEILANLFKLAVLMNDRNKEYLSELLIEEFPDMAIDIYENIKDDYSLKHLLQQYTNRIRIMTSGV